MIKLKTKLEVEMRQGRVENVYLDGRKLEIFRAERSGVGTQGRARH